MNINIYIKSIGDSVPVITDLLTDNFGITRKISERLVNNEYMPYVNTMKDELWVVVEVPYVDKVYRDSYYNYFSTKLNHEKKDCIRISIFKAEINYEQFRNEEEIKELRKKFLGFIVLRPTPPFITGRSLIAPEAFKSNSFKCCMVEMPVSVNSVKMSIKGFPHSSQDTETITCAETTLWACMEYFGFKYPDYKPILPSHITNTLKRVSFERQLPSNGLNILQMSSALKEFGFGSKIYHSGQYGDKFPLIFSSYIESGIPVIIGLTKGNAPGHATLGIGREVITDAHIDGCLPMPALPGNIQIFDLDNIAKKFILIDDNYPPYQTAFFGDPCKYYLDPEWHTMKINYFVVPLYSKIYLEAYEAKKFVYDLLSLSQVKLADDSVIALRFYLTSSRSYKDWIAASAGMQEEIKEIILTTAMPKFIWVAELGTKETFKLKKATGLVLLDATGANTHDLKPLIFAAHTDQLVNFDPDTKELVKVNLPLQEFSIYEQNLKN